jgi:hypothetical protein
VVAKFDFRADGRRLINWLNRDPTEKRLFNVACIFAERGMLLPVAVDVLKSNCPLSDAEFTRTIENAFSHIQRKRDAK